MPTFETSYCPISDLPVETCAHCRQGTRTLPAEVKYDEDPSEAAPPGAMTARYPGTCPGCSSAIRPGRTVIRPDGAGGWICESCT
jgi:hypothetical protein